VNINQVLKQMSWDKPAVSIAIWRSFSHRTQL
jgi:hypothetical protein